MVVEVAEATGQSESEERVLVIGGPAGMGKSIIAAKLMEKYSPVQGQQDWEGSTFAIDAAFFCKHNDSRRRDASQMLVSVAYQLCVAYEGMQTALAEVLEQYSTPQSKWLLVLMAAMDQHCRTPQQLEAKELSPQLVLLASVEPLRIRQTHMFVCLLFEE